MLREAKAHQNKRTWPTVYVMIETVYRLAELIALRRKDLDMTDRKGELLVREGKETKSRTLPINPEQRRGTSRPCWAREAIPEDPVFTSRRKDARTGRPSRSQAAGFKSYSIDSKNGSGGMSYTRTCYATLSGSNLHRAGTDWPVIAQLMGHASIVTTMTHYGTPVEKDLVKAMNRHGGGDDD